MIFKKKIRLLNFLLIGWLLISFGLSQELEAQEIQSTLKIEADDAYIYPVRPGTKAWKKLKNHEARVEISEVPIQVLKRMSTKGVLKTAFEYPFWFNMFWFDSPQKGYEVMKSSNNALLELVQRKDAAKILTDLYLSIDAGTFAKDWNNAMKGIYTYQINLLEYIILDENVFKQLTSEDKEKLSKSCLEKLLAMKTFSEIYGKVTTAEAAGFGGKLLLSLEYSPCKKLIETEYYWMDFLERKFPPNSMKLVGITIELLKDFTK